MDTSFHNGLVLFAAQVYHKCNIGWSQNHIMFRGTKDNVKATLKEISDKYSEAGTKLSSRKSDFVETYIYEDWYNIIH